MPNWCQNDLSVRGGSSELSRFEAHANGLRGPLDFNKFIPYPKKFTDMDEQGALETCREKEPETVNMTSDEIKVYLKLQGKKLDDYNIHWRGFNNGGFEWCAVNWDTKWPASNTTVRFSKTSLLYLFDTAWGPPSKVIIKMGEMFPKLKFHLKYKLEGNEGKGVLTIENGKVIKNKS